MGGGALTGVEGVWAGVGVCPRRGRGSTAQLVARAPRRYMRRKLSGSRSNSGLQCAPVAAARGPTLIRDRRTDRPTPLASRTAPGHITSFLLVEFSFVGPEEAHHAAILPGQEDLQPQEALLLGAAHR